ncbi:coiled-coil domain-containing protein 34 [Drosophila kikkawai]|uniref:Coiled-coil domain-containing protein 34 n=1 Tax=Drosophila kikkawai TaxID=30033 RepID=A0A6P4IE66_DROKI|nr:coiled-coil domain-containing protein 34 [Drosophila kikkawai]
MAFCGYVNVSGDFVLRDETYMGDTVVRRTTSPSDSPTSLSSPVSLPQHSTGTISVKDDMDGSEGTTMKATRVRSPDAWSLMYGEVKQSLCVPSLQLDSRESSVNYLRNIDSMKGYREADAAYENWYSAKRRQRLEKRKVLQQEHNDKQEQAKHKKQLAQMCYDQWLKRKARQAAAQRVENHMQSAAFKANQSLAKNSMQPTASSSGSSTTASSGYSSSSSANKTLRNVPEDKIRQVVEDWWLKKQQQHQTEREEKRRALVSKALEQKRRKELAEMAWQQWMSNVDEKPKPVPLNQGMDSLRGTISPLFVNPRPWVDPLKPSKM